MNKLILLFCLLAQQGLAQVWDGTDATNVIPRAWLADWSLASYVGCRVGPFTNRTVFTNLVVTEGTDIQAALQGAVNSCPSNQAVVIPAGSYFVDGNIQLAPHVTIKGSGMVGASQTLLNFRSGGFTKANDNSLFNRYHGQRFTLPIAAGTTNITVSDGTAYTVGKLALLSRYSSTDQYESNLVISRSGQSTTNSVDGFVYTTTRRVDNIAGNVVTIWPPLEKTWTNDACLYPMNTASKFIGLEDFAMICSNVVWGVILGGVTDSWIKRVKFMQSKNYDVFFYECQGVEFTECWVDDANKTSGSNGSHLLANTCGGLLVHNNIFINGAPCLEINFGTYRSVFAYNYLFNTNGQAEIYSNHGQHNTFNLYEGNVFNHLISDGYFGGESEIAMYRNWIMGMEPATSTIGYVFGLKRFTRNSSYVGNISGIGLTYTMAYDGQSYGGVGAGVGDEPPAPPWASFPTGGAIETAYLERDSNVLATAVAKLNYNFFDDGIPSAESSSAVIPPSLYLAAKPWFFPNSYTWPPVNSASVNTSFSPTNTMILPAQYAYFNGGIWPTDSETPVTGTRGIPVNPRLRK